MEELPESEDAVLPIPSAESMRAQKSTTISERTSDSGGMSYSLPKAVVVSGLEHTTAPSQRALTRALAERRVILEHDIDDTDTSGRDLDVEDGIWNLPDGFLMVYVCKSDPYERPAILRSLVRAASPSV